MTASCFWKLFSNSGFWDLSYMGQNAAAGPSSAPSDTRKHPKTPPPRHCQCHTGPARCSKYPGPVAYPPNDLTTLSPQGPGPCVFFARFITSSIFTAVSASGQGNTQQAQLRINTNPSFLISFNNQRIVIHLKTASLALRVSVYLPTFRSVWYFSTWVFFFFCEWMRWQVPHPKSSVFFLVCIKQHYRFLSSPFFSSSASPSLWALQHRLGLENSTLQ